MLALAAKVTLEQNKILRIMGPANVVVESGCVKVLGLQFKAGSRFLVHRYRSYAIKAVENSVLSITLGEGGSIEEPAEGEEVVDEWERIAQEVTEYQNAVVVVIGPVDSGKTSLSTMIANIALSKGLKVAVIDGDIGQGDLAPPGFIALKFYDRGVLWLRELRGDVIRFVGYITPTYATAATRLVTSIRELVEIARSRGFNIIIVNTDGWVTGYAAIEHKLDLIKTLKATHVLVLDDVLAEKIMLALRNISTRVYSVPRPRVVRERNRIDRRTLRRQHYQSFFQNAKRVCIDISELSVLGSCLFSGYWYPPDKVEELSKNLGISVSAVVEHDDVVVVFVEDERGLQIDKLREVLGAKEVFVLSRSSVKGILVSILNEFFEEVAPAIIDYLSIAEKKLCLLTEYNGPIKGIMVGRIRLSETWEEVGKPTKCLM